jgi:hypothetical protein
MESPSIRRKIRRGLASASAIRRLSVAAGAAALLAGLATVPLVAQEHAMPHADGTPVVSIKDLMEKTITTASNTIWAAYEPPASDEDWLALEDAAITMLVASQVLALGGTGPMDNEWARDPAFKAFNTALITASASALAAAGARDHAALLAAGDALYPPCEECHLQFNPGAAAQ